jgi:hypothetical protein
MRKPERRKMSKKEGNTERRIGYIGRTQTSRIKD